MSFKETRCSTCFKHFCCSEHRDMHVIKTHKKSASNQRQQILLKKFQKKAEVVIMKSQEYKANIILTKTEQGGRSKRQLKRSYSTSNNQILTSSVNTLLVSRQIIIPVRRLKEQAPSTNTRSNVEGICESQESSEVSKESPITGVVVQTSTPITSHFPATNEDGWNNIVSSSSSNEASKCDEDPIFKTPSLPVTPLYSIMSKRSKYDYKIDSGSSNNRSSQKIRRVTFSFNSQVSSTSPLESVKEEIHEEIHNEKSLLISSETKDSIQEFKENTDSVDISPQQIKDNGFFTCLANFFCSTVLAFPFSSWRKHSSKRPRSPDGAVNGTVFDSPFHKRRCYNWDLRHNPIKSRRSISST